MQNTNQATEALSVDAIFKEAWQNVKGIKGSIFMAEIYIFFIAILFLFLFSLLSLVIGSVLPQIKSTLHIISAFISGSLLICGIAYLNRFCIKKLGGCDPVLTWKSFFRPYRYFRQAIGLYFLNMCCLAIFAALIFLSLVLTGIVFAGTAAIAMGASGGSLGMFDHATLTKHVILGLLGLEMVIVFFIYSFFSTVFQMAIPVAISQKIRVSLALKLLFINFSAHFFKIVWINILCFLIILISIIPLGLGLLWSLPLAYNLNASIYNKTLGLVVQKREED